MRRAISGASPTAPDAARCRAAPRWRGGCGRERPRKGRPSERTKREVSFRFQKEFSSAIQQPAGAALHHKIDQPEFRLGVDVDGNGPLQKGLELLAVLVLHAHVL